MTSGQVVFSGEYSTSDGEVLIRQHTHGLYLCAKDAGGWVEVKLNGGPHSVFLGNTFNNYTFVPGDYTKFEVVTAGSTVVMYAIG